MQVSTREVIIRALHGLVVADGFAAVNVSSVAAAAGVSRQTVYSIFGTREAMVSEAVQSVVLEALQGVFAELDATGTTSAYVVELVVAGRREVSRQPVLTALLGAERGNPLFDEGMMGRARPLVAGLLEPLRARDPGLQDDKAFDALVEVVTRLGMSVVLFDSDATRGDDDLRRFMTRWIEPALGA